MHLPDGIYAAAVTPRRLGVQDINLGVLWDLIDFLTERKVDGIALLGCTGEFVHYSNSERMRMMGLAPKRSRVPVIINVSHSTLDGAVELAQAAAASGASGVLLMPPYFFRYNEASIRTFVLRFVEESDINVPVLLYNVPQFGNAMPEGTMCELLREGVVHGVKDSSGDWNTLSSLIECRRTAPCMLMVGHDSLFPRAHGYGVNGAISGVACAIPELMLALHGALSANALEAVAKMQERLYEFLAWIDKFPVPVGIREAVAMRGLKLGPNATPLSPDELKILAEYREWFKPWLQTVLAECKRA